MRGALEGCCVDGCGRNSYKLHLPWLALPLHQSSRKSCPALRHTVRRVSDCFARRYKATLLGVLSHWQRLLLRSPAGAAALQLAGSRGVVAAAAKGLQDSDSDDDFSGVCMGRACVRR